MTGYSPVIPSSGSGQDAQKAYFAVYSTENITVNTEQISKIMQYYSSPGGTNEIIHLYVANVDSTDVGGIYGLPEEGEDILVKVVPREQAMQWLAEGKVINAATIIGLQWLQMNYQQLQADAK